MIKVNKDTRTMPFDWIYFTPCSIVFIANLELAAGKETRTTYMNRNLIIKYTLVFIADSNTYADFGSSV